MPRGSLGEGLLARPGVGGGGELRLDSGANRPQTLPGRDLDFQQASGAAAVRPVREALLDGPPCCVCVCWGAGVLAEMRR